ncbi:MAG: LysR substrate-binding domain-containing protein [Pseudomonadota bacterium]
MIRNLDLTALRSLVAVADTGGVTRASQQLNLTQSAVSMQLKRLEEALDIALIDRSARSVSFTAQGEQMLSYARRLLALNDEALTRMTAKEFEGEVRLGVPTDIVYPHIPTILQQFDRSFPRMRVTLVSSFTKKLRALLEAGELDVILTTEERPDPAGETLSRQRLLWIGAPGGQAWRQRPLRVAFERNCLFKGWAQKALDDAGLAWTMAVDTASTRTVEASVSADLAVHAMVESAVAPHFEKIDTHGALPVLPTTYINLYYRGAGMTAPLHALVDLVRETYALHTRTEVA